MASKFETLDIKVDGEVISAPIVNDLTIQSIGVEMDTVAAAIGYWGNVLAAAQEDLAAADSVYRNWRAQMTEDQLQDDPKLAEWKIKAKIESHADFLAYKEKIARAARNVTILENVIDAYKVKGGQLQSRGANLRAELEKTGVYTRGPRIDDDDRGRRTAKVRGIFSGKRKKNEGSDNTEE